MRSRAERKTEQQIDTKTRQNRSFEFLGDLLDEILVSADLKVASEGT